MAKRKLLPVEYYAKKGFKKQLTIYMNEATYRALEKQAKEEERTMQIVARRILEQATKTNS